MTDFLPRLPLGASSQRHGALVGLRQQHTRRQFFEKPCLLVTNALNRNHCMFETLFEKEITCFASTKNELKKTPLYPCMTSFKVYT